MKEKLTKERALTLHRWMWNDMREALGNNPDGPARSIFKQNWLYAHSCWAALVAFLAARCFD